jgi:hypothetical protein
MKKKIAIIGRGTAGAMASTYFSYYSDCAIDWYFDPSTPPQAVGEGSTLSLPRRLNQCLNFSSRDLHKVDGTVKTGIYKEGWGERGLSFTHDFPSPQVAMHFNALKLQDYIFDKLNNRVTHIEGNILSKDIDADFIMDCSGKPKTFDGYTKSSYIPVNSVYVNQCWWDFPKFTETLAIARPYGWVFGIPLKNRCSVGYMYNNTINTLDEVKDDVNNIFEQFGLVPSDTTNSFSFNNYRKDFNYNGREAYNGNASFFLEPLEATSFQTADYINSQTYDLWFDNKDLEEVEVGYQKILDQFENIIMLHYFAGSKYKTPFWDFAKEKGQACIEKALSNKAFKHMVVVSKEPNNLGSYSDIIKPYINSQEIDILRNVWWEGSFSQNMDGLGIREKLNKLAA